jgi:hypothetical protein
MLSPDQELLLYELYGVTKAADTVIDSGFYGLATTPNPVWQQTSLQQQLEKAIELINDDSAKVDRVGKILSEYQCLGLDPSNIDRDGYTFRYRNSLRRLKQVLYTYTGVIPCDGQSNTIPLG